jgi:DNA-directed RNA polymerase II subunit RPB2
MEAMLLRILDRHFKDQPLLAAQHHLHSYDDFVTNVMSDVVVSMNPIRMIKDTYTINMFVGGQDRDTESKRIEFTFVKVPCHTTNEPSSPYTARTYNHNYAAEARCDVEVLFLDKVSQHTSTVWLRNIHIGTIPIMVKSKLCFDGMGSLGSYITDPRECGFDCGGYFIIDGKEKVIVSQNHDAQNRPIIVRVKDTDQAQSAKYSWKASIENTSSDSRFPRRLNLFVLRGTPSSTFKQKNAIVFTTNDFAIDHKATPKVLIQIPVFLLFRALGVESDLDIIRHIHGTYDPPSDILGFLYASICDAQIIHTRQDAFDYLSNFTEYRSHENVKHLLATNLFPNITSDNFSDKALYLGWVVRKLMLCAMGYSQQTDRDSVMMKRTMTSGYILGNEFRDAYRKLKNQVRDEMDRLHHYKSDKTMGDMVTHIKRVLLFDPKHVTEAIYMFMKRNISEIKVVKEGAVQDLSRISHQGFLSHLRRVNTPMDASVKLVEPHKVHASSFGYMCPSESPDGQNIGLLNHMAITCHISAETPAYIPIQLLFRLLLLRKGSPDVAAQHHDVFCNGTFHGVTHMPWAVVNVLKMLKRVAVLDTYMSVSWRIESREVHICTEAGRCCRPLVCLVDGALPQNLGTYVHKDWDSIVRGDLPQDAVAQLLDDMSFNDIFDTTAPHLAPVEYLDGEESNVSLIAMTPSALNMVDKKIGRNRYTHCELHPSIMFSALITQVPFANHTQAPRLSFYGAQGKQAIGTFCTSFNHRFDRSAYILYYPQRPIVKTRFTDPFSGSELPSGENLIVAVATYTGYNQEDAIIINRSSCERGCFNLTAYKTVVEMEAVEEESAILFGPPLSPHLGKPLDPNGFPVRDKWYDPGDPYLSRRLVDKTHVTQTVDKTRFTDGMIYGFVDDFVVFKKSSMFGDVQTCKVKFRKRRAPELGDKLCSRHGQKGIIGAVLAQEEMPFTRDGLVPDIIINPNAFPSRMTVSQLIDCLASKLCVKTGNTFDATAFQHLNFGDLFRSMQRCGLYKFGDEVMYDGKSGKQMETEIFIGPTYYHRLKHMVADKQNVRRTGKMLGLTKQPVQGRAAGGGLKLGEMERDVVYSHGVMGFLKESFMERSDKHRMSVSLTDGQILRSGLPRNGKYFAPPDSGNIGDHVDVMVPYSFKLLQQELAAMSIDMKLLFTDPPASEEPYEASDIEY